MVCHHFSTTTEQSCVKEPCLPTLNVSTGCVCVCLGPEASVQDEIRVMCQALWLRSRLGSQPLTGASAEQREFLPLLFLFFNCQPFSCFHYYTFWISPKVTGSWYKRVTKWSTIFSANFSKVSTYKFWNFFWEIKLYFLNAADLAAAGWDLKRNLLEWDEWRVEWKIKNQWTTANSPRNKKDEKVNICIFSFIWMALIPH